jgi:hypothetical protein
MHLVAPSGVRARFNSRGTEFEKKHRAALPDRDNAALSNCFTPNPATKAIAITIIWRRLVELPSA